MQPRKNLSGWRRLKDRFASFAITVGGSGVLFTILLIFLYLLYEVLPLFNPARIEEGPSVELAIPVNSVYASVEEQGEIFLSVDKEALATFFSTSSGRVIDSRALDRDSIGVKAVGWESNCRASSKC